MTPRRPVHREPTPPPRAMPTTAPPFFVPAAESLEQAERVRAATIAHVGGHILDERIYAAAYVHDGRACVDIVGEPDRYNEERILMILRSAGSGPLLICTASRGVIGGSPIFAPNDAHVLLFRE